MRHKTKREDITDIERYCNRMLANQAKRFFEAQEDREDIELPLSDREAQLSAPTDNTEERIFDPISSLSDWPEMIENKELFHAVKSLSDKEKHILLFYAVYGYTQQEIALQLACPQQSISRIVIRIKDKLKKVLKE